MQGGLRKQKTDAVEQAQERRREESAVRLAKIQNMHKRRGKCGCPVCEK